MILIDYTLFLAKQLTSEIVVGKQPFRAEKTWIVEGLGRRKERIAAGW